MLLDIDVFAHSVFLAMNPLPPSSPTLSLICLAEFYMSLGPTQVELITFFVQSLRLYSVIERAQLQVWDGGHLSEAARAHIPPLRLTSRVIFAKCLTSRYLHFLICKINSPGLWELTFTAAPMPILHSARVWPVGGSVRFLEVQGE